MEKLYPKYFYWLLISLFGIVVCFFLCVFNENKVDKISGNWYYVDSEGDYNECYFITSNNIINCNLKEGHISTKYKEKKRLLLLYRNDEVIQLKIHWLSKNELLVENDTIQLHLNKFFEEVDISKLLHSDVNYLNEFYNDFIKREEKYLSTIPTY